MGGSGQQGHGGFGGHALVTSHTVDNARANAHAVNAVFLGIHLGGLFIAVFVSAVERGHRSAVFQGAVGRHRAGIAQALDARLFGGFKHIHRAHHIHQCATHGVGTAKRHLQCRQMDDGSGFAVLNRGFHRSRVGDVALIPMHFFQMGFGHQQCGAAGIGFQIESAHRHTGMCEQRQHPTANTASCTCDQHRAIKFRRRQGEVAQHGCLR